jgi:hypothetical protein
LEVAPKGPTLRNKAPLIIWGILERIVSRKI